MSSVARTSVRIDLVTPGYPGSSVRIEHYPKPPRIDPRHLLRAARLAGGRRDSFLAAMFWAAWALCVYRPAGTTTTGHFA
jgi:hypothetical protein